MEKPPLPEQSGNANGKRTAEDVGRDLRRFRAGYFSNAPAPLQLNPALKRKLEEQAPSNSGFSTIVIWNLDVFLYLAAGLLSVFFYFVILPIVQYLASG